VIVQIGSDGRCSWNGSDRAHNAAQSGGAFIGRKIRQTRYRQHSALRVRGPELFG
jgi:hypothetical protein